MQRATTLVAGSWTTQAFEGLGRSAAGRRGKFRVTGFKRFTANAPGLEVVLRSCPRGPA